MLNSTTWRKARSTRLTDACLSLLISSLYSVFLFCSKWNLTSVKIFLKLFLLWWINVSVNWVVRSVHVSNDCVTIDVWIDGLPIHEFDLIGYLNFTWTDHWSMSCALIDVLCIIDVLIAVLCIDRYLVHYDSISIEVIRLFQ